MAQMSHNQRQNTLVFLLLKFTTYQKDLSHIRPTEAESIETRITIFPSSVMAPERYLFDTENDPASEPVVKPFAEREVISFGSIAYLES